MTVKTRDVCGQTQLTRCLTLLKEKKCAHWLLMNTLSSLFHIPFLGLLLLHHVNLDPYKAIGSHGTDKIKTSVSSMRYSSKLFSRIHYHIEFSSNAPWTIKEVVNNYSLPCSTLSIQRGNESTRISRIIFEFESEMLVILFHI